MHTHACILIWDAHTHMGHDIVSYVYGMFHTCMVRYKHMGQNNNVKITLQVIYQVLPDLMDI